MKLEVFILGGQRIDQERMDGGEARGNKEREKRELSQKNTKTNIIYLYNLVLLGTSDIFHFIIIDTILNYYFTDEDNCIIVETSEIKIFILSTSVGNK